MNDEWTKFARVCMDTPQEQNPEFLRERVAQLSAVLKKLIVAVERLNDTRAEMVKEKLLAMHEVFVAVEEAEKVLEGKR